MATKDVRGNFFWDIALQFVRIFTWLWPWCHLFIIIKLCLYY